MVGDSKLYPKIKPLGHLPQSSQQDTKVREVYKGEGKGRGGEEGGRGGRKKVGEGGRGEQKLLFTIGIEFHAHV